MLRVELRNAKTGMKLALPVYHPQQRGHVLLRVGFELDDETLQSLGRFAVRHLWIRYPSLDTLSRFVDPQIMTNQQEVVDQIGKTFQAVQTQSVAKLSYDSYCRAIGNLVDSLIGNPQAALFLNDLKSGDGLDLLRHSSTTTYLSLLMGLRLEGYLVKQRKHVDPARAKEVNNLGVGAMLHDLGIPQLEETVRERYQNTQDEADPAWREHPSLGYELVHGKIEPTAATVVLNHHQRMDGSGYAGKGRPVLEGQRIHIFPRIVGLAEQFDRLRYATRTDELPTVSVLNLLLSECWMGKFDPQVLAALLSVTPPYPPGSMVRLSNGRWAVCIDHNVLDPCRPVVQIVPAPERLAPDHLEAGPTIDLSLAGKDLHVAEYEGRNVSDVNFPPPVLLHDRQVALAIYG